MKRILIYLIMILFSVPLASAEEQTVETQRYVVANKKGKARFVPIEPQGDKWIYTEPRKDIYLENGVEFDGFKIKEDKSLNYKGTHFVYRGGIVFEYEGQHYIVVFPDKDIKPVDENGNLTAGLGIRNYLSNTFIGDFYRTPKPGVIALVCAVIALIFLIAGFFKDDVPSSIRIGFALPVCIISLLELGAAFSIGTDGAWWVNPDDVGYWIATPLLIPYALTAAVMIFSYKIYGMFGKFEGALNIVVSTLMIIGIILTVISAIYVVINFLFAACMLIGAGWLFSGMSYKDAGGNTINSGPLGTYKTDRYGNTTRIN